jgi:hypothetical protein
MKKTIKTLTFAIVMSLSLSLSATDAFAKDVKHGRETAWTDLEPQPVPAPLPDFFDPLLPVEEFLGEGVTWEE